MNSITWDSEAQCEFSCSALRYAKLGGAELAERFVAGVESAIMSIRSTPLLCRPFHGEARKARVARFPYAVVYWHEADASNIHIVAITHLHREPGYWRERIE